MRTSFILAAAFAAAGTPALAADIYAYPPVESPVYAPVSLVTGHVEIMGGIWSAAGYDSRGVISGAGRASVPLGQLLKLELEVTGGSIFREGYGGSSFGAYAHLYGDGPSHALGVFGGYTGVLNYSAPTIGIEGYFNLTPSTILWAQAAYLFNTNINNITYVRGGVHQYFSANTRATLDLALANNSNWGNAWSATGSLEHRFASTPWSIFGSVGASGVENSDVTPWMFMVGARLFVDQPGSTLGSHDKAVPFNVRIPAFGAPPT